ncbi:MAG: arylesterase [Rhodospirillales bacterium]
MSTLPSPRHSLRYDPIGGLVNAAALAVTALMLATIAVRAPCAGEAIRLLAFGDSLIAGYGLAREDAFPRRLERALAAHGLAVTVIDAGVSGDTSADGLARLDWALATPGGAPDAVIVELGANDALRGIDPEVTYANLDAIVGEIRRRRLPVLLAGMRAPPNMGRDYADAFDGIYSRLAAAHGVPLYPFFLDGVAAEPALNQVDGIHPNAEGVQVIVRGILPAVKDLLEAQP